jgi:hypothetical protein
MYGKGCEAERSEASANFLRSPNQRAEGALVIMFN